MELLNKWGKLSCTIPQWRIHFLLYYFVILILKMFLLNLPCLSLLFTSNPNEICVGMLNTRTLTFFTNTCISIWVDGTNKKLITLCRKWNNAIKVTHFGAFVADCVMLGSVLSLYKIFKLCYIIQPFTLFFKHQLT